MTDAVRPPQPQVAIPRVSLPELILVRAEGYGSKLALIDGLTGQGTTFGDLAVRVRRTAAGLHRLGIGRSDTLLLLASNHPDYASIFLAAALLGGILTTINPAATPDEVARQARDSNARYLFTVPELLGRVRTVHPWSGIITPEGTHDTFSLADLGKTEGTFPKPTFDPESDVVVLPYSSGTTGTSKGVRLTHTNLVANLHQIATPIFSGEDVIIGLAPFFHIYGLTVVLLLGLFLGATDVVLPRFEVQTFADAVRRYGVTHANLVPPLILALAKHPSLEPQMLESLKTVQSGAAPLPPDVASAFSLRFHCRVLQGYGLTETSPVTHVAPRSRHDIPVESIGPPVANTECELRDVQTGRTLGVGSRGELYVRGPQVMQGYLNAPEKTDEMIDAQGWLRTGDIAWMDDQGNFYIVDRAKELIKYKAYPVAPAELEAILLTHPDVDDAAVIPSPDTVAGEVPKAYVVARRSVPESALLAWVAERVAPYKKIRRIEFIDAIPKSASGKILRRMLIEKDRVRAAEHRVDHLG